MDKHDDRQDSTTTPRGLGEEAPIVIGSNSPIALDDPDDLWLVTKGVVDVFAVRIRGGIVGGERHHLFRAHEGDLLMGFDGQWQSDGVQIIAVGTNQTAIARFPRSRFQQLLQDPDYDLEMMALLDGWIANLSIGIEHTSALRQFVPIAPHKPIALKEGQIARTARKALWVRCVSGSVQFLSKKELPLITEDDYIPLADTTWLYAPQPAQIYAMDTPSFVKQALRWEYIENFHRVAQNCILWNIERHEAIERERLRKRGEYDQGQLNNAFGRLAGILHRERAAQYQADYGGDEPLFLSCQAVGNALGVRIVRPPDPIDGRAEALTLEAIIHASGLRAREVALRDDWWRRDNGPLLGYWGTERHPVALLPASSTSYNLYDPITHKRQRITPQLAQQISRFAFSFYPTLPNRPLTLSDLARFGLRDSLRDVGIVVWMGVMGGLLSTLIPLITGRIFDMIIPAADRRGLVELVMILLVAAFATAIFQVVRSIAVLRIEMKFDGTLQSAIWDRLLNLPTAFFRGYSAGDLSSRAMGVSTIRRTVSGTIVLAMLSSVFSLFNFLLLFILDARLAVVATTLVLLAALITWVAGYRQMRYQRALADIQGNISGLVLQLITGISKLRIAGVENRAFAQWAQRFGQQKRLAYKAGSVENALTVFNMVYPIMTLLILFAFVVQDSAITTGVFLAFNAAFTQFLLAGLELSNAFISVLRIVPNYERMKPILQTLPEVDATRADPGELTGEIEVNHVSFRYKEDGPLILKDISFQVRPGDFVALVGPSGSGKSTLLRLLLGFERPTSGAIFYDGQDLSGLDIRSVRRQLGVVLQNSQLMTGDIYTNIVGIAPLSMEAAWEAAEMAGLADDIRQMPMGMHTIVSEGGTTLSGGQRQRLLIARAIAKKPKILFFDEATSALDNRTQAIVSESLESLDATRIVIAHRLSTIIHADRILVFERGAIVQSGTYESLMREKGLFAELARRQLV